MLDVLRLRYDLPIRDLVLEFEPERLRIQWNPSKGLQWVGAYAHVKLRERVAGSATKFPHLHTIEANSREYQARLFIAP